MDQPQEQRIVSATRDIGASPEVVFEAIADPARQPEWDGNDNLAEAEPGQRVRAIGDVFRTTLTNGGVRENHVVELDEGCLLAWRPATAGEEPAGHLWRWELEPIGANGTRVVHTYDWTDLQDPDRVARARSITADYLHASLEGLARVTEAG